MELSKEQSEVQAQIIKDINSSILLLNDIYLKIAAKEIIINANQYDSAAALNPFYDPDHSKINRMKAEALLKLIEYKEQLIEITKLQLEEKKKQHHRNIINDLFL